MSNIAKLIGFYFLDPTIKKKPKNVHPNVHFKQVGLSNKSGKSEVMNNQHNNKKSIGMISNKMPMVTIFGHNHFKQKFYL